MADEIAYVGDPSGEDFLDVKFYEAFEGDKTVIRCTWSAPGDKTNVLDELVDDYIKQRFNRKWTAYQNLQDLTGTPIQSWLDIPEGLRNEFSYQGFRFVEQVAGAPESAITRIMGGLQWRTKAQAFLNRGKVAESELIKQQAEQIAKLQEQMSKILEAQDKPKIGRPAKNE